MDTIGIGSSFHLGITSVLLVYLFSTQTSTYTPNPTAPYTIHGTQRNT